MSRRTRSSVQLSIKSEVAMEDTCTANAGAAANSIPSTHRQRKIRACGIAAVDDRKTSIRAGVNRIVKKAKLEHQEALSRRPKRDKVKIPAVRQKQASPKTTEGHVPEKKESQHALKSGHITGNPRTPNILSRGLLIRDVMDKLYPDPPIPLDHTDNFTLLCGVLMSAQTTDGKVNEVTKELFQVAPDPLRLSKMSHSEVLRIIRPVGLAPTKAKNLIALAQQLLDRFDGEVPNTHEDLQSLPGVGRKTASVVMAQAFGKDAFPVDTHIHRLALRWGLTRNEKNATQVEQDLMIVFPQESWSKLHLQMIYFGREYCQARVHNASSCPVCSWVKKTGPRAPKTLSDISCLTELLASPKILKKSSKHVIMYAERLQELEQFRMKVDSEG